MTAVASATSIERALAAADAEERRQATTELGGLPLDEALPMLLRSLGDEDWRVRKEATLAARAFGAAPPLVAALIGELAEGDNVGLRNAAVDVLAGAGHAATRALGEALAAEGIDADGRKLVVETLGKGRDPAALGALESALGDPDDNVRQGAIEAIAGLGPLARERVQGLLLGRLDDRDRVVRLTALEGLTALEVAIPWERLAPLLADASLRPAALSAAALADSPEAARALAGALVKARGAAFHQALKGLGRLAEGPLAATVAEALSRGGPELGRRLVAAALTDGRGDETAARRATALRLAAAAGAPGVVDAAVGSLAEDLLAEPAHQVLTALGAPALPAMVARLGDGAAPPETRAALVDAISEVAQRAGATASAMGALRAAARDPDRHVAVRALRALSRLGEEADLPLVAAQTLTDVRPVAAAAEGALSALAARFPAAARAFVDGLARDEGSILPGAIALGAAAAASVFEERDATFLAHAATAGDTRARRAAVEAVSELRATLGATFPGAMEVLRIALADEEHEVQTAAARALGRVCTAKDPPRASDILDLVDRSGEGDLVATTVRAIGEGMARARGVVSADLVPALGLFARGAPSPVAMAAVEALGEAQRAGAPAGLEGLEAALDHPDEAVVKAALLKLAAAAPAGLVALVAVARGLEHPSTAVRILAVEMLADSESEEARRWLVKQLFAEPDRKVQEAIQRALAPRGAGALATPLGEGGR